MPDKTNKKMGFNTSTLVHMQFLDGGFISDANLVFLVTVKYLRFKTLVFVHR